MNSLTVWNPFKEMEELHDRLSTSILSAPARCAANGRANWMPPADILEDEKAYYIVVELPGLTREEIEVKVEGDWLQISGERKPAETQGGMEFRHRERFRGSFVRRFRLSADADSRKISAAFRDGLLQVSLPKREEAKPKVIDIKVG